VDKKPTTDKMNERWWSAATVSSANGINHCHRKFICKPLLIAIDCQKKKTNDNVTSRHNDEESYVFCPLSKGRSFETLILFLNFEIRHSLVTTTIISELKINDATMSYGVYDEPNKNG
jgi:hypothetical protein